MKLTIILLITICMQVSLASHAQKITLVERSTPLSEILKEIRRQSGYYFIYNIKSLENAKKVTVNIRNGDIEDVLKACFSGQPFTYKIHKKTVVIKGLEQTVALAPPITVRGVVSDSKGGALPGVTVRVKGTGKAVVTNAAGEFVIDDVENDAVLIVSFLGFATQEIPVKGSSALTITMQDELQNLNEIVVVGYGTQKKINLTGAVQQVGKEVFENRPLPNITRALQGQIPNLNIRMTDGKPTRGATYNIRGATSIGAGGNALVLIDGVPGDPNLLNPNDVENVSVLADASSAAIYGARGAFGVVLITTKKPQQDKVQVRYNTNYSLNERTVTPDMVWDGYTWAKMFDEAFYANKDYKAHPTGVNNAFPFSLSYLDELKARQEDPGLPKIEQDPSTGNYIYYGSTDWLSELYRNSNPSLEHSLSVSNGTNKGSYYLSGRYYRQDGIYNYSPDDFDKYNFRAKGDIKVSDWLTINNNLDFSRQSYFYPLSSIYLNGIWRNIADQGFPMAMMYNPDGTLTQHAAFTVGDYVQGDSHQNEKMSVFRNTVGATATLFNKQLRINGDFTYSNQTSGIDQQFYPVTYSLRPDQITSQGSNKLTRTQGETSYYAGNLYGEYTKDWKKHSFKALVGYNIEYSSYRQSKAEKDGVLNPDLPDFNLTDGLNYVITGGGNDWGIIGGFYRLNYSFQNKYLFEFNGRYDGSSKFPEDQRFGFFPSASAGWRISEERFMDNTKSWLTDLKLRGSYGSLGNGQIDPYLFQQTMSVSRSGVLLGGVYPSTTTNPAVLPAGLTWEKSTTFDIGLDLGMFNNRFNLVFDWYNRTTTDMFTALQPLPRTFGATVPRGNNADLSTKGWDLVLSWKDKVNFDKPLSYNLRFILSDNVSTITKFNNPTGSLGTYYVGQRLGEIWGYETDGLFQSFEEIKNHADQSYIKVSDGNVLLPGDIKFKDLNGDGKINDGSNTLSDPGDRKIIGNTEIRYSYGFNLDLNWNNFSLSAFFQGVGKRDWWPGTEAGYFWGQYNRPYGFLPEHIMGNYWTADNTDAYFPRIRGYSALNANRELSVVQSRYLQNASYIRLKNLSIGYNLPERIIQKLSLANARLYFTGQNLWAHSPMYKITKNFDPEVIENSDPEIPKTSGKGYAYPMLKSYTLGIDITF